MLFRRVKRFSNFRTSNFLLRPMVCTDARLVLVDACLFSVLLARRGSTRQGKVNVVLSTVYVDIYVTIRAIKLIAFVCTKIFDKKECNNALEIR